MGFIPHITCATKFFASRQHKLCVGLKPFMQNTALDYTNK